jgi:hypothetical protein
MARPSSSPNACHLPQLMKPKYLLMNRAYWLKCSDEQSRDELSKCCVSSVQMSNGLIFRCHFNFLSVFTCLSPNWAKSIFTGQVLWRVSNARSDRLKSARFNADFEMVAEDQVLHSHCSLKKILSFCKISNLNTVYPLKGYFWQIFWFNICHCNSGLAFINQKNVCVSKRKLKKNSSELPTTGQV